MGSGLVFVGSFYTVSVNGCRCRSDFTVDMRKRPGNDFRGDGFLQSPRLRGRRSRRQPSVRERSNGRLARD